MEKKLLLIILTPVSNRKSDDTIRSKSNAGNSYADGWDRVFGPKTPSNNAN